MTDNTTTPRPDIDAMPALELLHRLRKLAYAVESAEATAADLLPERYAEDLRAEVHDCRWEVVRRLADLGLTPEDDAAAVRTLESLESSAKARARLDLAARVFASVPTGDHPLGRDRVRLIRANFAAMTERLNAEESVTETLLELLPDKPGAQP